MFDETKLKDVLHCYKRDFKKWQWRNEKYKWEAVKCFQDNWDINAADLRTCFRVRWLKHVIYLRR